MAYDGLNGLDIVVIVLYFIVVVLVGLWSMYNTNRGNAKGYFLAGRTMLWWPVGASLFASNIGTGHFIGLAGTGAASGVAVGAYEIMAVFAIITLGWIFVPVYVSSGVYTMPEYLRVRYGGQRLRIFMSVLALFLYIFTKLSVDIFAGAVFIQQTFGSNIFGAIFILLGVTAVYTITGGLAAVIYTDTLQTCFMMIGGFILMILSFLEIGGVQALYLKYSTAVAGGYLNETCGVPRDDAFHIMRHPIDSDQPWPGTILGITIIGTWYWCTDQVIVQRALSAKNVDHAKAATVLGGWLKLTPFFLIVLPGMVSRALFPDEVACSTPESCQEACGNSAGCSNIAYPKLILELMPTGLRGLMLAAMMAALMSSLTSIFNSGSTIFTMDIWRRIRPKASNTELMTVGRLFVVVLVGVSILWIPIVQAAQSGQLFVYIQSVQSYFAPPIFVCFVMGLAWGRINEKGAFWGIISGNVLAVVRLVLDIVYPESSCGDPDNRPNLSLLGIHYLYFNCLIAAVSFIVTVGISLLTERPEEEKVIGKTFFTRGMSIHDDHSEDNEEENGDERAKTVASEGANVTDMNNAEESVEITSDPKPMWKKVIYWFCGYSQEESSPEETKLMTSVEEDPFWSKVTSINAVILVGVAFAAFGLFW
ncbi:Sodium/myo-inositol cotransporter 2 [Holothuria leucospilota]|uniref:Sodium/myo-inositol cotransporter 2 n=1 Tax=Holothuria leucospilota TaxID=206669 RepID=A0A9Q0YQ49_HOLLE|nr:Sodium/myo-inositol cotransporter 2 [Holothuria leucospilota]